jgi:hypothetical protein
LTEASFAPNLMVCTIRGILKTLETLSLAKVISSLVVTSGVKIILEPKRVAPQRVITEHAVEQLAQIPPASKVLTMVFLSDTIKHE